MKNATQSTKKLTSLLNARPEPPVVEFPDADDPVAVLVQSFLLWESTTEKAKAAYARLREHVVDFNDLRVTMPNEMAEYIGTRYPKAVLRCQRLRAVLRNVYLREHSVSLEELKTAGKREVKKYVESLEGIVPYVEARLLLMCFDSHAVPVDEQLRDLLAEAGIVEEGADVAEVASWLARQIKAKDAPRTHAVFQAWSDTAERKPVSKKKSSTKKTTKKTPRKKTAGTSRKRG